MADLNAYLVYGAAVLGIVFVIEAIYALFFRNFGAVKFQLAFNIPGASPNAVWATYFDERNDWNSVIERLSYEVLSENPRIVRLKSRLRGMDVDPVTSEMRVDILEPERRCRATVLKVDDEEIAPEQQTPEEFEISPTANGTDVTVRTNIAVRGWLWVPLHRRNLGRIYEDLRMACMRKAGVPFTALERRWGIWTVKRS
jgi:hypothetical protein